MKFTCESYGLLVEELEYFSLFDTLTCGQTFRYEEVSHGYGVWSKDKYAEIEQQDNRLIIRSDAPDYFIDYLALNEPYGEYNATLSAFPELTEKAKKASGVRLLRQDAFEMIISFIISANNNIPRIKKIISRICEKAGEKTPYGYAFPTRERLMALSEADFVSLGCGYRSRYLASAIRQITDEFIMRIKTLPTAQAMKALLSIMGVGAKVADCIMLFGLGRGDTFPVDVWMEKTLANENLNTNAKIRAYYLDRYGSLAGLAQQYIFHCARNLSE